MLDSFTIAVDQERVQVATSTEWYRTGPGVWECQLRDGSIWRWEVSYGETTELTSLHARSPSLCASSLSAALAMINKWIG